MVNPFGEKTSGSKYEWMSKYESEKARADVYQARVSELQGVIKEYEEALNELLKSKEELETDTGYLRQMIAERDSTIADLQAGVSGSRPSPQQNEELKRLRDENQQLRSQAGTSSSVESGAPYRLKKTLLPMILAHFTPDDERFSTAFKDFVEAVIEVGDTQDKIIANLIKYGGSGPLDKLRAVVNESDFDFAMDQLEKLNYLKTRGDRVGLGVGVEDIVPEATSWRSKSLPEIFETLESKIEMASDSEAAQLIEFFRDSIQERDIPATTIFFSIRKVIEGIQKRTMSRADVKKSIDEWKGKLL